jgi:hypothetical protein
MVARVGRRGMTAVVRTQGRRRRLAGRRGSRHRCGAQGGVGEFGRGPR